MFLKYFDLNNHIYREENSTKSFEILSQKQRWMKKR